MQQDNRATRPGRRDIQPNVTQIHEPFGNRWPDHYLISAQGGHPGPEPLHGPQPSGLTDPSFLRSVATGVALAVAVVAGGVEISGVVMRWCRGLFLYLVRYRDLGAGEQRGQGDRVSIGSVPLGGRGAFSARAG